MGKDTHVEKMRFGKASRIQNVPPVVSKMLTLRLTRVPANGKLRPRWLLRTPASCMLEIKGMSHEVYYSFSATNNAKDLTDAFPVVFSSSLLYAATLALNFDAAVSNSWLFSSKSTRNACCGAVFLRELQVEHAIR